MNRITAACALACVLAVHRPAGATDGGRDAAPPVEWPTPAACAFRAKAMWRDLSLELAPGVPYVEVHAYDAIEVSVPIATVPALAGVKVQKGRITLAGLVPAAKMPLHPARPFVIGDLFLVTPWSELRWASAADGEIEAEVTLAAATVKSVGGVPRRLRARRACGD